MIAEPALEKSQPEAGPKDQNETDAAQFAVSEMDEHNHDYPHIEERRLRDLPLRFSTLARFPLLALIRLYQMTLSRALPADTCRFYPSCSHYGYQAVYKYGALKGGLMATWRVLRCNPFSKGGFDPLL
ncbi:membrane protein insertion efficiency factor YidD [Chloroflexota bacterium]